MASRSSILAVKVLVDAKDAKELDTVASKVDKVGESAANWAKGALGAAAIGALGKAAIDAASNLEQAGGAVDAVFKNNARTVHEFADSASTDLGMSESAYLGLASTIGAQLKNAGTSMDDLAPKTDELIGLGADLAAQFGGSSADAISAISSLLRGERDPIERYGASINQAAVDAEILALGLDTSTEAAKKAASQTATLSLLYEQTADAQGAASREADTYAGTQARMQAVLEDTAAAVGTALLPAMGSLMELVADLAPLAGDLLTPIAGLLTTVLDLPGPLLAVVAAGAGWMMFGTKITGAIGAFKDQMFFATKQAGGFKQALGGIGKSLAGGLGMGLAAGAVGLIIEGFQHTAQEAADAEAAVSSLADALVESGGVMDEAASKTRTSLIEQSTAFQELHDAGMSYHDAMVLLGGATGDVNDVTARNIDLMEDMSGDASMSMIRTQMMSEKARQLADARREQAEADELAAWQAMTLTERTAALADKTDEMVGAVNTARGAMLDAEGAAGGMADQLGEVDRQAKLAGDEAKLLGATIDELTGRDVGLEGTIVGWAAGIDDLAASFVAAREAGEDHTAALAAWDVKALSATDTGRDLYTTTSDQADAYRDIVAETYSSAAAHGDLATAEDDARKAADDARAEFVDMMTAQLGSRDAAEKLADKLGIVEGIEIDDKYFLTSTETREASDQLDALNAKELHDKTLTAHENHDQAQHDLNMWISQQRSIVVGVKVTGFSAALKPMPGAAPGSAGLSTPTLFAETRAPLPAVVGTGRNITINVSGALDAAAVGRQIRDLIRADERRSGTVRMVGAQ